MHSNYEVFKAFMIDVENVTKLIPAFWVFMCELFVLERKFECSDIWRCVLGYVIPDVSKDKFAFNLKGQADLGVLEPWT